MVVRVHFFFFPDNSSFNLPASELRVCHSHPIDEKSEAPIQTKSAHAKLFALFHCNLATSKKSWGLKNAIHIGGTRMVLETLLFTYIVITTLLFLIE